MAKPLVSDALWQRIEPLLPPPPPRRQRFPGRKSLGYRKVLTGIVFVLKTGIDWEELPAELGWGCGKTCKKYLKAWQGGGHLGPPPPRPAARTPGRRQDRLVPLCGGQHQEPGPGRRRRHRA